MKVELKAITNSFTNKEQWLQFSRAAGRICYTDADFERVLVEEDKKRLIENALRRGHHSLFEHVNLTFYLSGIPKILAMILNNERQYATSEKSARFTVMKDMDPNQKKLYDKWMDILKPLIDEIYPPLTDPEDRQIRIKKLAQENARYMTSVFTPTKMVHTINLRQVNFLIYELGKYAEAKAHSSNKFEKRIAENLPELLTQLKPYFIAGLENQTDRHLSMFNFENWPNQFSDTYSTSYQISFAGLAQQQRHRTIGYNMEITDPSIAPGFFVPKLVKEKGLIEEWLKDLNQVAQTDYPQGELVWVRERGFLEDFRSKAILRLCGHTQHEAMRNTLAIGKLYAEKVPRVADWLTPKCKQGMHCAEPCVWGGKNCLERIV